MSSNLESLVNTIRNLYQQQQQNANQNYADIINVLRTNMDTFKKHVQHLETIKQVFTLPEYTCAHLALVYAQSQAPPQPNVDKLLDDIEVLIHNSHNKQIGLMIDQFSEMCHFYTNKLIEMRKTKRGLLNLKTAIGKIQKSKNQLTCLHADLVLLSLESKNFTLALELFENDTLDINTDLNSFDSKHYLLYFYYSGCVFTALKDFDQALFYFEQAITIPCVVVSQIMIEAYKKYIILSLIIKAKLLQLPKYTSRHVLNQIKPQCAAYHEITNAFTTYDLDKLTSLIGKYESVLRQDGNFGLIKQLVQSFYKKNIQKLTKTFMTLSLADMAQKVRLASAKEAEQYVLNMIKDGEIYASINQKDGMVSFHDNPEKYDSPLMTNNLMKQMSNCISIDHEIKDMDKEITTHPHYIQKCMSTAVSLASMGSASGGMVDELMG